MDRDATSPQGDLSRRVIVAVVALALFGGLSGFPGCGSGEEAVRVLLPRASRGLHWVGDVAPAGSTLAEVAHGLGTAIDTGTNIQKQFEEIAGSEDPWGKALVTATCYGLEDIAKQYDEDNDVLPASAQGWEDFLTDEVAVLLPSKQRSEVNKRVAEFNNAAALASIQPRAAATYVNACVLKRS